MINGKVITALSISTLALVLAFSAFPGKCRADSVLTRQRPDLLVEDFEGTNFGAWKVTGEAFGSGPAHGTLPHQMAVDGFLGGGFASSYHGGDGSMGKLTSPAFTVARDYIQFLIGGGGFAAKTCINLLCDGQVVRTATGANTQPGGSEHLDWQGWDYSDIPASDGRRIQFGWLRAPSPGMPFNQCLSVPLELKLLSTPAGVRLTRLPVAELAPLRNQTTDAGSFTLEADGVNPLAQVSGERLELRAEFEPSSRCEVDFNLRGLAVSYMAEHQELIVNGHRAPAPLRSGKQRLVVYVDRTASEVFASDGLTYVPLAFLPPAKALSASVRVKNGSAKFTALRVYELNSIWQ